MQIANTSFEPRFFFFFFTLHWTNKIYTMFVWQYKSLFCDRGWDCLAERGPQRCVTWTLNHLRNSELDLEFVFPLSDKRTRHFLEKYSLGVVLAQLQGRRAGSEGLREQSQVRLISAAAGNLLFVSLSRPWAADSVKATAQHFYGLFTFSVHVKHRGHASCTWARNMDQ